jgi:uncharacterized damage-inducible protein DinB
MPTRSPRESGELALLLELFDEAYERKAWHGPNLKGSIRGLSPETAAWRPAPARHNIWEQVLHAAYWKYVVRRRLLGEKRGSFPLKGSNWFMRPETMTIAAWQADVALLDQMHRALREAIAALDPRELPTRPAGSKVSNAAILRGIAAHDVYHAGQIQLLKRLAAE